MKKTLLLGALLFSFNFIFAQNRIITDFQFGIYGGGNLTAVAKQHDFGNNYFEYKAPKLGYVGGISIGALWNGFSGIQIDGIYSVQGYNHSGVRQGEDMDKNLKLSYIQVPVMYKQYIPLDNYDVTRPMLILLAGGQFGYLMSADLQYFSGGSEISFLEAHATNPNLDDLYEPADDKELYLPFDFALVLGIGLDFPISEKLNMIIEGRGNIGVKDINGRDFRFEHPSEGTYNKSVNLLTGIKVGVSYDLRIR